VAVRYNAREVKENNQTGLSTPRPVPPYELTCTFRQLETGQPFDHATDALILATGYNPTPPTFLDGINDRLN
jgi:lysine/ornithine N-monooxygenase